MSDRLPGTILAEENLAALGVLNADWFRYAADFAKTAHGAQVDKSGRLYFDHPFRVASKSASLAQEFGLPMQDAVQIALLHDVLEDTAVTESALQVRFRAQVFAGVQALTRPENLNYTDWIRKLRAEPIAYILVKLADIFDNLSPERKHPDQRSMAVRKYLPAARMLADSLSRAHSLNATLTELEKHYRALRVVKC